MLPPSLWSSELPLQGGRVRIRPFTAADLTVRYIGWLNDPQTVRFSNQRFRRHDADSAQRYFNGFAGTPHQFLAIEDATTSIMVGTMTVYVQEPHGTADVGILLGESEVRGRGYGKEAWKLVILWLLKTCQVRKVTAGTLACNHGMVKLMELAGMHLEATRVAQELVENQLQDVLYFARFHAD